jgi:malate dehydrogenase
VSTIAILGAGAIGAATGYRLAQRNRVRRIRLVDAQRNAAQGKALDIRQSGPIHGFDTDIDVAADPLSITGADAIVLADSIDEGEWIGDRGLALLQQLARAGTTAPIVFAGPAQFELIDAACTELKYEPSRLIGTASTALTSAVQSLAALELQLSAVELTVAGRPNGFVIGWSAAAAAGSLVTDMVPAHRLRALTSMLPRLWPPGPHAIGAATAVVVEALVFGSRRLHTATTIVDGLAGARGAAISLPMRLGRHRVLSYAMPSLSAQERTELMNGVQAALSLTHSPRR